MLNLTKWTITENKGIKVKKENLRLVSSITKIEAQVRKWFSDKRPEFFLKNGNSNEWTSLP